MMLSGTELCSRDQGRLRDAFGAAARQACLVGRPVLASVILTAAAGDPLTLYTRAEGLTETRAYWSSPAGGLSFAGVDAAWTFEGGPGAAASAWRELVASALLDTPEGEPLLVAGFAFDPARPATLAWDCYPPGLAFLPRLLVFTDGETTRVRASAVLAPGSDPRGEVGRWTELWARLQAGSTCKTRVAVSPAVEELLPGERWRGIVAGAVSDLERLGLEKVVLARAVRVRSGSPFAVGSILSSLRAAYPSCFVFAFGRGDRCFLGATPEQLVSLRDEHIDALSLAGTIGRSRDEAEDAALAARLAGSAKEQNEHSVVVQSMRERLVCAGAQEIAFSEPAVLKLPKIQHLQTRLTARPAPGTGILDLVEALHPTPAVGGYPREKALHFIREREELDRGWYAGPVGWVDAAGEGEFAVALRSALIHEGEGLLFAGCGIVPGSDPAAEYVESCLKLRPMLTALGAGGKREQADE